MAVFSNETSTTGSTENLVLKNPSALLLPGIMSHEVFDMLVLVVGIILIFLISTLGTVLNIFNIIVFTKQGLNDAVNITLFGLAVSDLGSVLTLLLMSGAYVLHFFPHLIYGLEIRYLAGFLNWPHAIFVRVACLLTVFVAFERCLCVVIPLHVHRVITPMVAKVYNVFILIFILCWFLSLYSFCTVRPIFLPHLNKTIMGIWFTQQGRTYSIYVSYVVGFVYMGSFILVAVLASVTAAKLNQQARWRRKMAAATTTTAVSGGGDSEKPKPTAADSVSARNQRVVKMVVVISVLFIVCTAPGLVNTILFIVFPEYKQMSRYDNMYSGTSMINFALEAANSTLNFFIYLNMSSNFSATFYKMMGKEGKQQTTKATKSQQ